MLETKVTTTRATYAAVGPGEPPSIALHKTLTRPDGKQKHVSLSIPIRDGRLLTRAEQELQVGDEIEMIIETRWAEEGIPKTLLDFSKVPASQGLTGAGSETSRCHLGTNLAQLDVRSVKQWAFRRLRK